jgi:Carboxypeptidase regulatory-like domain/TonB dependent receptor
MKSLRGVLQCVIYIGVCILMLLSHPLALPQGVTTGSIEGTVTDTSGAAVPGATVTITNIETNISQTISSRADGGFSIPNLAVTTYRVRVEKGGFSTAVRENVAVAVNQAAEVNVKLSPGTETQTVTVEAQAAPMTEDKGDRSTMIEAQAIEKLPLQVSSGFRQDDAFLTLAPGVTGNTFSARINGAPDFSQDFYYDGIPYMNADGGGRQENNSPPVDAIDQYAIDTNDYNAQYGRSAGILNFHIQSGTNQLHGGAWEYLRNNVLDSRGYFSATAGTEKQNEYGFKVGGPVMIPKLYDGRNKTFFFFLMDWYKFRGGLSTSLTTLPTPLMLQGNFSQLPYPIYDPLTTVSDGNGGLTRQAFPGNIIPQNRVSAISAQFLPLIPTSTLPGIVNNAVVQTPAGPINTFYPLFKIDHNFSPKLILHVSYYQDKSGTPTSPIIPGPLGSGNQFYGWGKFSRVSLDQNYAANLYNQTALGVQCGGDSRVFSPLVPSNFNSPIAIPGQPYPAISIAGFAGLGSGVNNNQGGASCVSVFFADNLKWQKGKHGLSFGTELRWEDEYDEFALNLGTYTFQSGTTSLPDSPIYGSLGSSFASFYLGDVNTYSRTGPVNNRLAKTGYRAIYVQDDIKLTPKLTVNLGLRWDLSIPVSDTHDQFSTFDPTVSNPGAGGLPGSIVFAGAQGGACVPEGGASLCRHHIANTYWNDYGPRLGFAYQLNDKTVIRGGAGKSTLRGGATTIMGPDLATTYLAGFQFQNTLTSLNNGVSPPAQLSPTWDVGIPAVGAVPPRTRTIANNQNIDYMMPIDGKTGYSMLWSITGEHQFPGRIAWELSYVGSSNVHIGANLLNENQVPSHYLSLGSTLGADINSVQASRAGIKSPYAGFTGTVAQALRPYPQFLNIYERIQTPGHSNYHSLQTRLQKQYSNGVNFLVSYTWSKSITDGITQFSQFAAMPLDTGQRRRERQVLGANADGAANPQNLSISGSYELPIGKGKPILNRGGVVGGLAGGWAVSGVAQYSDGAPLPITNPTGTSAEAFAQSGSPNPIFNGQSRPNLMPGVQTKLWHGGKFNPYTQYYVNQAAFSDAGPYALGNAPPTLPFATGFPSYNENISASKTTRIWESASFEFRADFFNVFNRVIFGLPDMNFSDVATGGFGKISSQANSPRVIQFGGRVTF